VEAAGVHFPTEDTDHGVTLTTPSFLEIRRKAPLHFEAKASNARFVAYLLWRGISAECLSLAATSSDYDGTPSIATCEAFDRESALALELIVKAVIAKQVELGGGPKAVPAVHDVPLLWGRAGLPALDNDDHYRLLKVKSLLTWSARYAAPKTDLQYHREMADFEALHPAPRSRSDGKLRLHNLSEMSFPLLDWENFDRLYQIATRELWKLRSDDP
jgi:hypothetical protein